MLFLLCARVSGLLLRVFLLIGFRGLVAHDRFIFRCYIYYRGMISFADGWWTVVGQAVSVKQ